jgi:hypothetical protein
MVVVAESRIGRGIPGIRPGCQVCDEEVCWWRVMFAEPIASLVSKSLESGSG